MQTSTDASRQTRDTLATFDGKNPDKAAKWFELAVGIERFAEFNCGSIGVEIWLGIAEELTDENVSDAAEEALAFIRIQHGIRDGDSSARDDDFWQVAYQNEFRNKMRRKLYQYIYDHSSDVFRTWLNDYEAKDVDTIRADGMREFGQVNRGTMLTASYAGLPYRP